MDKYRHDYKYLYRQKCEELEVYKKALELMSMSYFGNKSCIVFQYTGFQAESNVDLCNYFIEQAKRDIKNGNL